VDRIGISPGHGDNRGAVPDVVSQQLERLRQVEERLADLTKNVSATNLSIPADFAAARMAEAEPESPSGGPVRRSRRWRGSRGRSKA
jgi:hypothetical protein